MPLLHHDFCRLLDALDALNPAQIEDTQTKIRGIRRKTEAIAEIEARTGTRAAAGCYHIQNVNSLHARYSSFITSFCGPATKNLNGYIRWLEIRLAGVRPREVVRAS